jgi:urease accessory protein
MTIVRRTAGFGIAAAALVLPMAPAMAHHVMGGKMPSTFTQGFLSGIGHPIIGVDHFMFIVGVGLLGALLGQRVLVPLAFVIGTWIGAALHLGSLNMPFAEAAIVVSILLMAVAVIADVRMSVPLTAALVTFAGLFHGYAYGESIFGAEPTPLYAYLAGFAVIQCVIAFAAAAMFGLVQKRSDALAATALRVAGGAMVGVALVSISGMLFPVPG